MNARADLVATITTLVATLVMAVSLPASAHPPDDDHTHHDPAPASSAGGKTASLAEIGAKLSDPTSNVWALFTEFDLTFSNGNLKKGDEEIGGNMTFQPIMPIPLYGEGEDQWKMITRPTIPFIFSNPVPQGFNSFNHETGLADMLLPLAVSPPASLVGKNWILGLGPTFTFPTATKDAFGDEQWKIGPALILGYKTKDFTVGVFPQYFFKVGSIGDQADKRDASNMSLLYFFFYNLPNAWQVGFNPNITYNNKGTRGNKWNVPIGLAVTKTTGVAGRPWKFQFGMEYSVVNEDAFGKRLLIKLNVIPVIEGLIKNPIFGGS